MPSEMIFSHDGDVDVRVAWGSNQSGTIQVATLAASKKTPHDATDRLFGVVNEWLKAADMPPIDVKELRAKLPFTPEFDGWHATLDDWTGANRMIKVLKRARDQAFGAPE